MGFFGDREGVVWFWFGGLALGSFGGSQGEKHRHLAASQVHCRSAAARCPLPAGSKLGRKFIILFIIYRAGRADRGSVAVPVA